MHRFRGAVGRALDRVGDGRSSALSGLLGRRREPEPAVRPQTASALARAAALVLWHREPTDAELEQATRRLVAGEPASVLVIEAVQSDAFREAHLLAPRRRQAFEREARAVERRLAAIEDALIELESRTGEARPSSRTGSARR